MPGHAAIVISIGILSPRCLQVSCCSSCYTASGWGCYDCLAPGAAWPGQPALRFLLGLGLFYGAGVATGQPGRQFLLSAHMLQHLLLIYPVPLLLLTGMPGWLLRPCLTHAGRL
jgi:cytochrome c oxidase assembly factor CtaG